MYVERNLLDGDEKGDQNFRAIRMSNRLTVAEIKLKRSDRLSEFGVEMKEINDSIFSLTDSLLMGEDVRPDLSIIEDRLIQFEQKITA